MELLLDGFATRSCQNRNPGADIFLKVLGYKPGLGISTQTGANKKLKYSLDAFPLPFSYIISLPLFNCKFGLGRLSELLRKQPGRDRVPELSALVGKLPLQRAHLLWDHEKRREVYKRRVLRF
jgi:hypothetical protein